MSWARRAAVFVAALSLLNSCSPGTSVAPESAGGRLRVFYNNDNYAYLEPCGCRVSPIGGMDRRWNAFQAYPEGTRVFVDAGNLLFKSTQASEFLAPQWFEQAVGVVEGYNLLGADAVAIGATDLALGVEKFRELAGKARFPFLSANIYWKGTAKPFAAASKLIQRQGKKIGVFALFNPALPLPAELEAKDPAGHARKEVAALRAAGADMVIALSHQGYDEDVKLAKAVPGIDLIVGAHSQSLIQNPDVENGALIVQLSNQGQMLGMVEYEAESLPAKRTKFVVDELGADYNDAPRGMANPMKNLLAVTNLRMAEANRKLDERISQAHQATGDGGFQTFLACRDCHGKQANFQEGKRHAAAFLTLVAKKQEMNLDCVKCHSVGLGEKDGFRSLADAFRDNKDQPVAGAMKKLFHPPEDTDYRKDPAKIRPDVARWIASMKSAGVQKSFVSVQCENCHGPKPGHPFDMASGHSQVLAKTCLQCHTSEQMPAWYEPGGKKVKTAVVDAALKSVACPR